jgi:fibronectin type 3 domain-containing protein
MTLKSFGGKAAWAALALAAAFAACPNPAGNNAGAGADMAALAGAIDRAEAEKQGVAASDAGAKVPLGTKWASPAELRAFEAAIDDAIRVRDDDSAPQSRADNAEAALNGAIAAFREAKKDGTAAPLDKGALMATIAGARVAKDRTAQAESAADAALGAPWAAAAQHRALDEAVAAAETARDSAAATTESLAAAASALEGAVAVFAHAAAVNGAGTKDRGFAREDIAGLIARARAAKAGTAPSENGDDVPPAGVWAPPAALSALEAAIDQTGASDEDYLALSRALCAFNDARQPGAAPNKQALFAAIIGADAARAGVVVAVEQDAAPWGSAWVAQARWEDLNAARAAALESANETNAAKNDVDAATRALETALAAFNHAKTANGPGTGANRIAIAGLSELCKDGIEARVFLLGGGDIMGAPAFWGSGTVANGSLAAVELSDSAGPWAGNGFYYIAFTIDDRLIFISKEQAAFNGGTVARAYDAFELPASSLWLGDLGEATPGMTLNGFIQAMSGSLPGGPYKYEGWKTAMKALLQEECAGRGYVDLDFLDYALYKDGACARPLSGADIVSADTLVYCRAPLEGAPVEAAGRITGTIALTGYSGRRPQVSVRAESNFYGERGYGWVDERGAPCAVADDGSFSIPFVQDFLSALQAGPKSLRFVLEIGSGGDGYYAKTAEGAIVVSAGQLQNGNLNVGPVGSVSLASVVLSGTITVAFNGRPPPRARIVASTRQGFSAGTSLNAPGPGERWSIALPAFDSPTDISLNVYGHAAQWGLLFSRTNVETVAVAAAAREGIDLNLGAIDAVSLSGTIDVSIDGQRPRVVEINAYADPDDPYNSQIGSALIENYNAKQNAWSMTVEAPPQGSAVYFRIALLAAAGSAWSGYSALPTSCAAPAPGGEASNIALSCHGGGLPAPTGLRATGSTLSSVSLAWDAVESAVGYTLYRSADSSGPYAPVARVPGTSYTDSGLSAGAAYCYYVTAVSSAQAEGLRSAAIQGATAGAFPPSSSTPLTIGQWTDGALSPGQTRWHTFTADGGTYYVNWIDAQSGKADIRVAAYTSGGDIIFEDIDRAFETPEIISGRIGTVYLRAQGHDSHSSGSYAIRCSQTYNFTAPTGLTVTGFAAESVSLAWNGVDGASSYRVYRSNASSGPYSMISALSGAAYADAGLPAGATYYYRVAAVSGGTEGPQSSSVQGTTFPPSSSTPLPVGQWTAGTLPAGQALWHTFASEGEAQELSWDDGESGNGEDCGIQVSAYAGDGTLIFADADSPPRRTISGQSGTVYLKVTGGGGSSVYAIRRAPPAQSGVPDAPKGLTATGSTDSGISLAWNSVEGASSYKVYRSANPSGFYKLLVAVNGTSHTDSGLSAATTYWYRVAAVSGGTEGPQSPSVQGTTSAEAFPPPFSAPLTNGRWTDGTLAAGQTHWYRFVSDGGTAEVSWDDSRQGSGEKTCDIKVSAYAAGGDSIFAEADSGHLNPEAISGWSGTIYLKVEGHNKSQHGGYAIRYSQPVRSGVPDAPGA